MIKKKCKCGHFEKDHGTRDPRIERPHILGICWKCRYAESRKIQISSIHNFELDNLSYIEALAKKKGLV